MQSKLQNSKQQKRESKIRRGALCAPYFLKGIRNTEHGITLVALIITVIVLLILAIVSIRLVLNGGIIDRAEKGTESYSEAEIKEQIKLAYSEWQTAIWDGTSRDAGTFITERLQNTFGNDNVKNISVSNGKVEAEIKTKGEFVRYSYDVGTETVGIVEENNSLLPDEYQQVEYIESTGTQYIDTGVIANDASEINMAFSMTLNNTTLQGVFGGGWSSKNQTFQIIRNGLNINLRYGEKTLSIPYDNDIHNIQISNNKSIIDEIEESNSSTINDNRSVYLFARRSDNLGNGIQQYSYSRIYYCNIYSDGRIIRKLVPCYRKSDNKPGLYDLANNVFYTNQGTGEFDIPEVEEPLPSEYQRVDYIQSSGAQYIDTGVVPNANTGFDLDFNLLDPISSNNAKRFFGSSYVNNGSWGGIVITTWNYSEGGQFVYLKRNESYNPGLVTNKRMRLRLINKHYETSKGTDINLTSNNINDVHGSLYLLNINADSFKATGSSAIIYSAKIYNGNNIIRNFIPCKRKSDSKPGLYDIVNNVFYTNQGSGDDFTAGPNVE